jgi:hypothetical protein
MKLLLCRHCNDIFNLKYYEKFCGCGSTSGKYVDSINIEYRGDGFVLGFDNASLIESLSYINNHPEKEWGENFTAFVIPFTTKSIKKVDKLE